MRPAIGLTRRDLFSELSVVFMDTTSLYFEGAGGESLGQRGHSKDHPCGVASIASLIGGLAVSDAKRLRQLETENTRLKRLLAEAHLDNAALKDLLAKNW